MATLDDILISVGIRDNTGGPSQQIQSRMDGIADSGRAMGRSLSSALALGPAFAPAIGAAGALASTLGGAAVASGALYAAVIPQVGAITEASEAYDAYKQAVKESGANSEEAKEALKAYQDQLSSMPEATQAASKEFIGLKEDFKEWSDELAADTMPVFTKGLEVLRMILPKLTPLVKGAAAIFGDLMDRIKGKVDSPGFDRFMSRMTDWALNGLQKTIDGIIWLSQKISGFVLSDGFQKFLAMGGEAGENIAEILRKLGQFMAEFVEAAGPLAALSFGALEVLADALNAIPRELFEILAPTILAIALAMKVWNLALAAYALYQTAANVAANGFPAIWIMAMIVGLIALIVSLWRKNETFRRIVTDAWNAVRDAVMSVVNWFRHKAWPWMQGVWDNISKGASDATQSVKDTFNDVIGWFAGVPGRIARAGRGMWDSIQNGLKQALNGAIYTINQGIWFINDNLIGNANRIPGVNIPWIPYIPYLAKGGITTGPTMAMIGEGREQEAVLPLSKLQHLLDVNSVAAAASVRAPRVQPSESRLVLELRGGSRAFREFFQESVRVTAGGDVVKFAEG